MKVIIVSDLHGAADATAEFVTRIEEEAPDKILLLGDILYHGPRNALPTDYAPQRVIELLAPYQDRILAVQGNCDAEVDQWMFSFSLLNENLQIMDEETGITLFATHGHRLGMNPDKPEELIHLPEPCLFCSGHTHLKVLKQQEDIIFVNPGSIGIPKDDGAGYAVYENGHVALKTLSGSTISQISFSKHL